MHHPVKPPTGRAPQRVVPSLDFDVLRPRTSETARFTPARPLVVPPQEQAPSAAQAPPTALENTVNTTLSETGTSAHSKKGQTRKSSRIVVGANEFTIPPLRDESTEIITKFPTRVTDGIDSAICATPLSASGRGKFFAARAVNNATIESWPLRSPSQTLSWTAEGGNHRASIGASEFGSTARAAQKPPLLKSMEDYIARELAALSAAEQANGGRLRVYREVMRLFVENFKTYGFIISATMSEYDRELDKMRAAEARTLSLETAVKAVKIESAERLEDVVHSFSSQLKHSEAERRAYNAAIADANDRQEEANSVIREVMEEVGNLKTEREQDLGKMLALVRAVKAADTRLKQYVDRIKSLNAELERMDDLKNCLAESEAKLAEFAETYQDTIPRKQYAAVKAEMEAKLASMAEAERAARRIANQRGIALDRANRVARQLTTERENMRGGTDPQLTPRPAFSTAARQEIDSLAPPLDDCPAMTTAALLDQCIARLRSQQAEMARLRTENQELKDRLECGGGPAAAVSHKAGAGGAATAAHAAGFQSSRTSTASTILPRIQSHALVMRQLDMLQRDKQPVTSYPLPAAPTFDNVVPSYFRHLGSVVRVDMPRKDVATTMQQVWDFRKEDRASEPNFHVSLHKFFAGRYGPKACSKAVNFVEGCQRYRHLDARCELLLGILDQSLPERLLLDVTQFVDTLCFEIRTLAGPERAKRIRKALFMDNIGKYLDYKSPSAKDALKAALGRDTTLDIEDMCAMDPLNLHPFFDLIILQGCDERIDLYTRLVEAFTAATGPDGFITHDDVENSIFNVDSLTSQTTVVELCRPSPAAVTPLVPESSSHGSFAGSPTASPALAPAKPPALSAASPSLHLSLLLERLTQTTVTRVSPA